MRRPVLPVSGHIALLAALCVLSSAGLFRALLLKSQAAASALWRLGSFIAAHSAGRAGPLRPVTVSPGALRPWQRLLDLPRAGAVMRALQAGFPLPGSWPSRALCICPGRLC